MSRRVSFSIPNPRESLRISHQTSRDSNHDSGLGSLSSDQASAGGLPDRMFTAQDRIRRSNSVAAPRRKEMEMELRHRERCIRKLEAECDDQNDYIHGLRSRNMSLKDDNDWLDRHNYYLRGFIHGRTPTWEIQEQEQTERLRSRINRVPIPSNLQPSGPTSHHPSVSIVVNSGPNSRNDRYIEEVPPAVPDYPILRRRSASVPRAPRQIPTSHRPSNNARPGNYSRGPLPPNNRR